MKTIVRLENVCVRRGHTDILRAVDWQVRQDEHWVLFGPNGAGKTTLLNMLTGYLWPTSGTARILGHTLGEVNVADLRRSISVVSESLRLMIPDHLTGLEVLVTGARAHLNIFEPPRGGELRRARETADRTGIAPLLAKCFGQMSTGERQRVLIGRALMIEPRLVILDEPCAGLDLGGREFLLEMLGHITRHGRAPGFLLATHHVEEIAPMFTHGLILQAGRVFAAGPLAQTLTSPRLSELFGLPIRIAHRHGRWAASCTWPS